MDAYSAVRRHFETFAYAVVADDGFGDVQGLTLTGGVGSGKSVTAAAYAIDALRFNESEECPRLVTVRWWNVEELLAAIRNGYEDGTDEEIIQDARTATLLILDDLGVERSNRKGADRHEQGVLYRISEARRGDLELPTLVTTNSRGFAEGQGPGARAESRLIAGAVVARFGDVDYRETEGGRQRG